MLNRKEELKVINRQIGRKLREARQLKGISQEEIANYLDITFQQIQKYENGKNRVSASSLFAIAEFLKLPIDFFFEEQNKNISETQLVDYKKWQDLYKILPFPLKETLYKSFLKKNK